MSSSNFRIEDTADGRTLVVTGPWSTAAAEVVARGDVDGLVLNYAHGFCERSLDLLDGAWGLRRLDVLDRSIVDLDPIARLSGLEELSVQAAGEAYLDLEPLPGLRSIAGEWALIGETLHELTRLDRVVTWAFGDEDLHAFRDHVELTALTIKDAPCLESLSGIGGLPDLALLTVVSARRLQAIDDVADLSRSLRELKFESCPRIDSIADIEPLVGLRFLGVSESGDIPTLSPVGSLCELEVFYAWGSTRVLDSDLSPLLDLPLLREIRMRDRREYTPHVPELISALAAR